MSVLDRALAETSAIFSPANIGKSIAFHHSQTNKYSPGYGILQELDVQVYHCSRLTCDVESPTMSWCGKCKNRVYCSKECQRKDWKYHKAEYCDDHECTKSTPFLCAKIQFEHEVRYVSMKNYVLKFFLVDDTIPFDEFVKSDRARVENRKPSTAHTMLSMPASY